MSQLELLGKTTTDNLVVTCRHQVHRIAQSCAHLGADMALNCSCKVNAMVLL